ncbi:MAG: uroporphyrinogen decarboxylase family protein [Chloroflexota bacterium]
MNKRERLQMTVTGESADRIPVALWRHFPGDDQRAADLARSHVMWMQQYDWDFLVVMPAKHYMVTDYGLFTEWTGNIWGHRSVIKSPVERTLHWTDLRVMDGRRGQFGKQSQCIPLIQSELPSDTPILHVIYSPLTQARQLAGNDLLLRSLRTQPDRLRTGLNTLTETTLRFIETLRRDTQIDGILYVTDCASYTFMSEAEYAQFGLPFDDKVLDAIAPNWWLNIIALQGAVPMLHLFAGMPVQALNWASVEARPTLDRAQFDFKGAFCAGLGENQHLLFGTPTTVRDAAMQAFDTMNRRRLILSAGHEIAITTPHSNTQAVRDAVERTMRL